MKRLLSIAAISAVSAATLLPLSAAAQARVHVVIDDDALVRVQERYVPEREYRERHVYGPQPHYRQHRERHVYVPAAWNAREGRYVEPRRFIDRNHDGMDDSRGRRDLDRDGIPDRYDRDLDNDGIANHHDRDMDGDGVGNRRDRRPDNPHAY